MSVKACTAAWRTLQARMTWTTGPSGTNSAATSEAVLLYAFLCEGSCPASSIDRTSATFCCLACRCSKLSWLFLEAIFQGEREQDIRVE